MDKPELEIASVTAHTMAQCASNSSNNSSNGATITDKESVNGPSKVLSNRLFQYDCLDRALDRPQITGIAFAGTVGAGLFVTSGEMIGISGSLGCVLSFIGAGAIVICVMRSLAEMVSVRPLFNALIDYPHTFVDPALGFAVGATYCVAQCLSMATLTSAATRVANNFHPSIPLANSQLSGIIIGFSVLTVLSNICGVKLYGNIERVVKWIKLLVIVSLCVLMIVINAANVGYPNYTEYSLPGFYKPNGFLTTNFNRTGESAYGILGAGGRFLGVWTSVTLAIFACMGGDLVIVSAGEAKNPRRDLPAVTRFMYLVPIGFYILSSFLVGFNINFSDPDLYRPWSSFQEHFKSHSPFIIVLKHSSLAPSILPQLYSALFMFSYYTAANTALFAASRTLFAFARTYGSTYIKNTIGKTNAGHTPLKAIFCCSIFSLLAFLGLVDPTFNQPVLTMSSFFTSSIACVYGAECVAYLRFKKGLSLMERDGLLSRNDDLYRRKHYRAHWQPTLAIFGLIGCTLIMLTTGWPVIYIFCARDSLKEAAYLKPRRLLVWDLIGTYAGPILFFSLYAGYKIVKRTSIRDPTDVRFRDAYELPEFDNVETERLKGRHQWKNYLSEAWSFIK